MEEREAGGLRHGLEALRHRLRAGARHDVALPDTRADHDEARELEVHARAEEQAGHEEQPQLPRLHTRDDGRHPVPEDVTPHGYEYLQ